MLNQERITYEDFQKMFSDEREIGNLCVTMKPNAYVEIQHKGVVIEIEIASPKRLRIRAPKDEVVIKRRMHNSGISF